MSIQSIVRIETISQTWHDDTDTACPVATSADLVHVAVRRTR